VFIWLSWWGLKLLFIKESWSATLWWNNAPSKKWATDFLKKTNSIGVPVNGQSSEF